MSTDPTIASNAIKALKAEVRRQHPDTRPSLKMIKRHGWCPTPTLLNVWTATMEITAKGYRPKRGILWVNPNGTWRFA